MNERKFKNQPRRLQQLFQSYNNPLYFVTFNTWQRQPLLATETVHQAFIDYTELNREQGRAIGRYVIMPDHIHLFVRGHAEFKLGQFVRLMKHKLTSSIVTICGSPVWQPGFFDHVLRNNESYSQKWDYVSQNPVRANLVNNSDDWPFQGEIVIIDRA